MFDDIKVLLEKDPQRALEVARNQWQQANWEANIKFPEHDNREITSVVIAGMGGSALAGLMLQSLVKDTFQLPLEVVRSYSLPNYVNESTLVIVSSYSGNTEETLSALQDAKNRKSQIAIISAGGELENQASENQICYSKMPSGIQPRMAVIYNLRAIVKVLSHFNVIDLGLYNEIAKSSDWLNQQSANWDASVPTEHNYAKQLALLSVGKSAVIFGGELTAPLAYKWKISWNENAKNTSFWNFYSEANHNDFIGWTSHPVQKPFIVFDLISNLEHPQIIKRFSISDQLLSGKRPKSHVVNLEGDTLLKQLLWGAVLADFISIYIAIANGVNPTPVPLIEKLKTKL